MYETISDDELYEDDMAVPPHPKWNRHERIIEHDALGVIERSIERPEDPPETLTSWMVVVHSERLGGGAYEWEDPRLNHPWGTADDAKTPKAQAMELVEYRARLNDKIETELRLGAATVRDRFEGMVRQP